MMTVVFLGDDAAMVPESAAVGDGGDGLGRAWVLEVILQVVVRICGPFCLIEKNISNIIEGEHVINFGQCFARAIIAKVARRTRQVLQKAGLFGA